jgi:cell division protein FtsB
VRGIWLIPALVGAVVIYAAIDDGAGLRSLVRLRGDLDAASERIEVLRTDIALLSHEADGLQTQNFALERAIREGLEYARPGETLVRLPRVTEP